MAGVEEDCAGDVLEGVGVKLAGHDVGEEFFGDVDIAFDAVVNGGDEAEAGVVGGIAREEDGGIAQVFAFLQGRADEGRADAAVAAVERDGHGGQVEDFVPGGVVRDPGFGEHDVADESAGVFSNQGQLGDVLVAVPQFSDEVLFVAVFDFGGLEGGLDEIVNGRKVGWFFLADKHRGMIRERK